MTVEGPGRDLRIVLQQAALTTIRRALSQYRRLSPWPHNWSGQIDDEYRRVVGFARSPGRP